MADSILYWLAGGRKRRRVLGLLFCSSGGGAVQLTSDPADDARPAWSPDGGWIAFKSNRSGNDDIWVIPAEGGAPSQITTNTASDTRPTWSPDGSQLAFASDRSGSMNIWVIGPPVPNEAISFGKLKAIYR